MRLAISQNEACTGVCLNSRSPLLSLSLGDVIALSSKKKTRGHHSCSGALCHWDVKFCRPHASLKLPYARSHQSQFTPAWQTWSSLHRVYLCLRPKSSGLGFRQFCLRAPVALLGCCCRPARTSTDILELLSIYSLLRFPVLKKLQNCRQVGQSFLRESSDGMHPYALNHSIRFLPVCTATMYWFSWYSSCCSFAFICKGHLACEVLKTLHVCHRSCATFACSGCVFSAFLEFIIHLGKWTWPRLPPALILCAFIFLLSSLCSLTLRTQQQQSNHSLYQCLLFEQSVRHCSRIWSLDNNLPDSGHYAIAGTVPHLRQLLYETCGKLNGIK